MNLRTQVLLWGAQRISAAVLGVCVIVHLITIIYAVRNGLTAREILDRTSGSIVWGTFYMLFVLSTAVHVPLGLRSFFDEVVGWRGRGRDIAMFLLAILLAAWGTRAVFAVVGAK